MGTGGQLNWIPLAHAPHVDRFLRFIALVLWLAVYSVLAPFGYAAF